ncbi:hypothetical protein M406DRAFT_109216 [Cryphonectria parasitica EP155]|uniref:RING-type domain-containing protein n=1 Tax=Cryphonectria parasitica (strain ATCC 38755 / EP155) TaxID=660469 RepID=A0A9P5CS58_CRYP1|nr:uncharacterized protein M406DRAFT_109216 [Cryphonectria parasitica EP155]KAF3768227.1 hypothetical protein M406DRAFT_109216 [Cryphonectria parasitica EP155]
MVAMPSPADCSICFDTHSIALPLKALNPCGHLLHETCVREWQLARNKDGLSAFLECAICRARLEKPYFASVWITPLIDEAAEASKHRADNERLSLKLQETARETEQAKKEALHWEIEARKAKSLLESCQERVQSSDSNAKYWQKETEEAHDSTAFWQAQSLKDFETSQTLVSQIRDIVDGYERGEPSFKDPRSGVTKQHKRKLEDNTSPPRTKRQKVVRQSHGNTPDSSTTLERSNPPCPPYCYPAQQMENGGEGNPIDLTFS